MISLSAYLAFAAASAALILLPGPNVALIVGTSLAHGSRTGIATVAGTFCATVLQLACVFFGLALLIAEASRFFAVLRWCGVAYLLVLGVRAWFGDAGKLEARAGGRSGRNAFARGFVVAATNPKTLLFYGAFLPQFLDRRGDVSTQMLVLSGTYLAIAAVLDSGWALLASRLRPVLAMRPRLRSRLTGGTMIGAAVGLALVHERA